RAIPPEPSVAKTPLCTATRSRQGRARQGAAISEPLPASTAVRSTEADGRSGGLASAILLVSSEQVLAYSSGVRYPRLLCGRSALYSSRQRWTFRRASLRLANQFALRHSSRNRPLKLSTYPFCMGRPGWICVRVIFCSAHH